MYAYVRLKKFSKKQIDKCKNLNIYLDRSIKVDHNKDSSKQVFFGVFAKLFHIKILYIS